MDYDILIVGGGLVGASLALGLNQLSLKVGLVDSAFINSNAKKIDSRTIALSATSCQILQALSGCSLDKLKTHPIKTIHISAQGRFAMTRLRASDIGLPALGYSIEMATMAQFLYEELRKTPCDLIPAQVKDAQCGLERVDVILETLTPTVPQKISAKLLIAADGDDSFLRGLFKISTEIYDYGQSAWVTTVETTKPHHDTAFERFIPNGSIALLPIQNKFKLVWIASTDSIKTLAHLAPDIVLNKLQKHIGLRLGQFHTLGNNHFIYPLKQVHVPDQVQEKFVLMGNSAHVLHPIAAQGFNLSLRDSAVLVEIVRQACAEQKNFAAKEMLQGYLVKRLPDQKRAANLTHCLASLFIEDVSPLVGMQSAAFNVLECFPMIKRRFTRFAMGSSAVLPNWIWSTP